MTNENTQYSLKAAVEALQRIEEYGGARPWRLVVRKHNPGGMSGHGTVEVKGIYQGIDHYAGRAIIETETPLTALTPEQVEDISKSVRGGQSWHAYQAQKKLREQIDGLKAVNAELLEALQALETLFAPLASDATAANWIDKARAAIAKAKAAGAVLATGATGAAA